MAKNGKLGVYSRKIKNSGVKFFKHKKNENKFEKLRTDIIAFISSQLGAIPFSAEITKDDSFIPSITITGMVLPVYVLGGIESMLDNSKYVKISRVQRFLRGRENYGFLLIESSPDD